MVGSSASGAVVPSAGDWDRERGLPPGHSPALARQPILRGGNVNGDLTSHARPQSPDRTCRREGGRCRRFGDAPARLAPGGDADERAARRGTDPRRCELPWSCTVCHGESTGPYSGVFAVRLDSRCEPTWAGPDCGGDRAILRSPEPVSKGSGGMKQGVLLGVHWWRVGLTAALLLAPRSVLATADAPSAAHASAVVEAALARADAGDFEAAAILFEHAYGIMPQRSVLYNAAQAHAAARHFAAAVDANVRYLDAPGAPLTTERHREVDEAIAKLTRSTATLEVRTEPPDATLRVDGRLVVTTSTRLDSEVALGHRGTSRIRAGLARSGARTRRREDDDIRYGPHSRPRSGIRSVLRAGLCRRGRRSARRPRSRALAHHRRVRSARVRGVASRLCVVSGCGGGKIGTWRLGVSHRR